VVKLKEHLALKRDFIPNEEIGGEVERALSLEEVSLITTTCLKMVAT